jgi:hypothetical protein
MDIKKSIDTPLRYLEHLAGSISLVGFTDLVLRAAYDYKGIYKLSHKTYDTSFVNALNLLGERFLSIRILPEGIYGGSNAVYDSLIFRATDYLSRSFSSPWDMYVGVAFGCTTAVIIPAIYLTYLACSYKQKTKPKDLT